MTTSRAVVTLHTSDGPITALREGETVSLVAPEDGSSFDVAAPDTPGDLRLSVQEGRTLVTVPESAERPLDVLGTHISPGESRALGDEVFRPEAPLTMGTARLMVDPVRSFEARDRHAADRRMSRMRQLALYDAHMAAIPEYREARNVLTESWLSEDMDALEEKWRTFTATVSPLFDSAVSEDRGPADMLVAFRSAQQTLRENAYLRDTLPFPQAPIPNVPAGTLTAYAEVDPQGIEWRLLVSPNGDLRIARSPAGGDPLFAPLQADVVRHAEFDLSLALDRLTEGLASSRMATFSEAHEVDLERLPSQRPARGALADIGAFREVSRYDDIQWEAMTDSERMERLEAIAQELGSGGTGQKPRLELDGDRMSVWGQDDELLVELERDAATSPYAAAKAYAIRSLQQRSRLQATGTGDATPSSTEERRRRALRLIDDASRRGSQEVQAADEASPPQRPSPESTARPRRSRT